MKNGAFFSVEVAARFNCANTAAVLDKIAGWQKHAEANGKNLFDGRHWVYNSVNAWAELLPWLSAPQIRRALDKLEASGVLITENYNKHRRDRTKWYTIADEQIAEVYGISHLPKSANGNDDSSKSHLTESANDICRNQQTITNNQPTTNQQPKDINTASSTDGQSEDSKTVGGVCLSDLPDYINADDWSNYSAFREKTKKPMDEIKARALLKRLRELHRGGHDVNAALQTATINGWLNVFPDTTKHGAQGNEGNQRNSERVTVAEQLRRDGERARQRAEQEARDAASRAGSGYGRTINGQFHSS
jgi:hypothetical protein